MSNRKSLLIVACSHRKRSDPGLLPAIIRYDGPTFFVLRRFIGQQPPESKGISVYILSAEFGLIHHDQLIPHYDHRMTRTRAKALQPGIIAELRRILSTNYYRELFISVGRDYLSALDGYDTLIPAELTVKRATGGLGKKLSELHD